jgi:hypothetical protein
LRADPKGKFEYFEDAGGQYVLLPYAGGLSALVVLPAARTGSPLKEVDLQGVLAGMKKLRGAKKAGVVSLPRFEVEASLELSEAFKQLGAQKAFTDYAEFSNVASQPLKIDVIVHKVVMEVDEIGTAAAAATAVMAGFGCAAPPPAGSDFTMHCDRPFAFCVVEPRSGSVLFAGDVLEPAGFAEPPPVTSGLSSSTRPPPKRYAPPAFTPPPPVISPISLSFEERAQQACLFTPACRRDVYRVLCTPPRGPLAVGAMCWVARVRDGQVVIEPRVQGAADDKEAVAETVKFIEELGQASPVGAAAAATFEKLLVSEYVPFWGDEDAAELSVAFLVAFGNELTPRLDIKHRIRSRQLEKADAAWLRSLPLTWGFEARDLDQFQGPP